MSRRYAVEAVLVAIGLSLLGGLVACRIAWQAIEDAFTALPVTPTRHALVVVAS